MPEPPTQQDRPGRLPLPSKCINCSRYWPESDRLNNFRGGGVCRSWRSQRGESRLNACPEFDPLETRTLSSLAKYCVMLTVADDLSVRAELAGSMNNRVYQRCSDQDVSAAVSALLSRMTEIAAMLGTVSARLSKHSSPPGKYPLGYFEPVNDVISNPSSSARKRFGIVVGLFPRNVRLTYNVDRLGRRSFQVMLNIAMEDRRLSSLSLYPSYIEDPTQSVPPDLFAGQYEFGPAVLGTIAAEFSSFQKTVRQLRDDASKATRRI